MSEGAERVVEAGRTIQCVVFDFGGGTCDVSVLEITADNKTKQILMSQIAVSRYHRLGGGDLDAGIALVVAIYSALKKHSASPALLILGDLSIQGNIKGVLSLSEPLQVGMDNGARRALIPIENKRHFLEVPADIVERVDPIFYGDPLTAAIKALGMN